MSTDEVRSNEATSVARVDLKLEVVVIPVSDADRAKEFYGRLGWRLDAEFAAGDDFRMIQFTPPRRAAFATKYPMSGVSRAVEKGETQGSIKISVDAETKQILGAAILGTGGDEVIHVLLDVMDAKAPYTVVQRAMHVHPTVAEYLPTVLSKLEPFA